MCIAHVAMTHRSGSSHLRGAAESHVHDRRRVRAVISALTTAAVQNPRYVFRGHSISNFSGAQGRASIPCEVHCNSAFASIVKVLDCIPYFDEQK